MTEDEWLTCADPQAMLDWLKEEASDRKLRLFATACCRRIWRLLTDARSRSAVEAAERFADGQASDHDLRRAAKDAWDVHLSTQEAEYHAATAAYYAVNDPASPDADDVANAVTAATVCDPDDPELETEAQVKLVRDIFGDPFRPAPVDADWLTPAVTSMAEAIYEERAFDRLTELADALERAGCTDAHILDHCRAPGPHVRGCWVVDLLLGKS